MKKCSICGLKTNKSFSSIALKKYKFELTDCPHCGFLQIDDAYWLKEAYSHAISDLDTGLVARNISLAAKLKPLLFYLFDVNGSYLDLAGGTGLFTRLMRDNGFNFYWSDLYCGNIHARGFEYKNDIRIDAITAFEVLEHLVDPVAFVSKAIETNDVSIFFFTTELFNGPPPAPDKWWYYAFDAGQHISFYQYKTLEIFAKKLNLNFFSNKDFHAFCKPSIFRKLRLYESSPILRHVAQYKSSRALQSKTWSDHVSLLG